MKRVSGAIPVVKQQYPVVTTGNSNHGNTSMHARTMLGCQLSATRHFSMHHQKSSSVSPFHANTGIPASTRAAATSFYTHIHDLHLYTHYTHTRHADYGHNSAILQLAAQ
jgi:hypothetical protein